MTQQSFSSSRKVVNQTKGQSPPKYGSRTNSCRISVAHRRYGLLRAAGTLCKSAGASSPGRCACGLWNAAVCFSPVRPSGREWSCHLHVYRPPVCVIEPATAARAELLRYATPFVETIRSRGGRRVFDGVRLPGGFSLGETPPWRWVPAWRVFIGGVGRVGGPVSYSRDLVRASGRGSCCAGRVSCGSGATFLPGSDDVHVTEAGGGLRKTVKPARKPGPNFVVRL